MTLVSHRGPGPAYTKESYMGCEHAQPPADKRRRRNLRRTRCPRSSASSPCFPARAVSASHLSPVPSPPSLPVTATRSRPRCRHHRSLYPQDVRYEWTPRPCPWQPYAARNLRARRQGHELQPAAPKRDRPVLWRGPVIAGAIRQFWSRRRAHRLPAGRHAPGTGDVALTVFQSLPVDASSSSRARRIWSR